MSCRPLFRSLVVGLLASTVACHGLLDVSDPTKIQDSDVANTGGANARRLSVVQSFDWNITQIAANTALMSDERSYDSQYSASQFQYLDQRESDLYEQFYGSGQDPHLGPLTDVVTRAAVAIPYLRSYAADSLKGEYLAQVFALRGYAIVQMAEDVCSGFPMNDIVNNLPIYGMPTTTDAAVTYALTQLDSAIANGHDSASFINLARVVKGRALLDLGRYADAAVAVQGVPTSFSYVTDNTGSDNSLYEAGYWSFAAMPVGEREGGNGLPFVSANDPRVKTAFVQTRLGNAADSLYGELKYPTSRTGMVVASGIEARLIEAEAALNAPNPALMIAILDTLRTTAISPAMATIGTAPGTTAGQVDLLYRERAFWLYLTGRRLGDMRRLIRNYARSANTVFPIGTYPLGGVYGTATSVPFVFINEARFNKNLTSGCTVR